MAKSNYIQTNDGAFLAQLTLFKNNIPAYAAGVGVSAQQQTDQAADTAYFNYVLQCMNIMQNGSQQWTTWKALTRMGGTPPPTGSPVAPVLPAAVPAVAPGIEARFRALAQQIKSSADYNTAIGEALGIEGPQHVPPDLSTVQPQLKLQLSGNRVDVNWGWEGNSAYLDQCEIHVDRGDGPGFKLLAFDTTPGYVDTAPLPATPVRWTYKAIYRVDDAQTGQWSNPVSLVVGG